jgi:hypothetical protein
MSWLWPIVKLEIDDPHEVVALVDECEDFGKFYIILGAMSDDQLWKLAYEMLENELRGYTGYNKWLVDNIISEHRKDKFSGECSHYLELLELDYAPEQFDSIKQKVFEWTRHNFKWLYKKVCEKYCQKAWGSYYEHWFRAAINQLGHLHDPKKAAQNVDYYLTFNPDGEWFTGQHNDHIEMGKAILRG